MGAQDMFKTKWPNHATTKGFWRQGVAEDLAIRETASPMHVYKKVQTGPNRASGGVHDGKASLRYHQPLQDTMMTKGTPEKGSVVWLRIHQTVGGTAWSDSCCLSWCLRWKSPDFDFSVANPMLFGAGPVLPETSFAEACCERGTTNA